MLVYLATNRKRSGAVYRLHHHSVVYLTAQSGQAKSLRSALREFSAYRCQVGGCRQCNLLQD